MSRTVIQEGHRYSRAWFRFFEILPGLLVWVSLIAPFILAYKFPLAVTVFIIGFDIYWLNRSLSYAFILARGHKKLKDNLAVPWLKRLEALDVLTDEQRKSQSMPNWRDLQHVIILTTYEEDASILRESIRSIVNSHYPSDKLSIILATEARAGEKAAKTAALLQEEFTGSIGRFLVSVHPDGIKGEVKAKGANATWAARQFTVLMEREGIPLESILVSTADADTRFHAEYFSRLSYMYIFTEDRERAAYQPVAMYFNNVWETPTISRVMAFGTTFWQLIESVRDYRLVTFATHSTSLLTLRETNYWCTSIVNEDSRQYFRAWFHYGGRFRTIPLLMPIYMDAVSVGDIKGTVRNLYLQQQRWAYGVEHFPYIVLESFMRKDIPWTHRFILCFRAFSGAYTWGTASFYLTFVGWLPVLLNQSFSEHIVSSYFTQVTSVIVNLAWVGIFVSGWITISLMQTVFTIKRKREYGIMLIQWVTIPITSFIFGAIPGIDAQTRLMLGKYLGFRVTEKAAVKTQ